MGDGEGHHVSKMILSFVTVQPCGGVQGTIVPHSSRFQVEELLLEQHS